MAVFTPFTTARSPAGVVRVNGRALSACVSVFCLGETVAVHGAPIKHEVSDGKGMLEVGDVVEATMHPFRGPDGTVTTLRDSLFSTVPGTPAYVAVADSHEVNLPQYDMVWSFTGRNAIQADYHIQYAP